MSSNVHSDRSGLCVCVCIQYNTCSWWTERNRAPEFWTYVDIDLSSIPTSHTFTVSEYTPQCGRKHTHKHTDKHSAAFRGRKEDCVTHRKRMIPVLAIA